MQLRVKRVKFGDCALLETEGRRLIVDCGSDNRGTVTTQLRVKDIKPVLNR